MEESSSDDEEHEASEYGKSGTTLKESIKLGGSYKDTASKLSDTSTKKS
jgi:hypothetical protein